MVNESMRCLPDSTVPNTDTQESRKKLESVSKEVERMNPGQCCISIPTNSDKIFLFLDKVSTIDCGSDINQWRYKLASRIINRVGLKDGPEDIFFPKGLGILDSYGNIQYEEFLLKIIVSSGKPSNIACYCSELTERGDGYSNYFCEIFGRSPYSTEEPGMLYSLQTAYEKRFPAEGIIFEGAQSSDMVRTGTMKYGQGYYEIGDITVPFSYNPELLELDRMTQKPIVTINSLAHSALLDMSDKDINFGEYDGSDGRYIYIRLPGLNERSEWIESDNIRVSVGGSDTPISIEHI